MSTEDEIKAGIRRLVVEQGRPVKFEQQYSYSNDLQVSPYGWVDWDAEAHVKPDRYGKKKGLAGCEWVVPTGILVKETTYSQFCGTFASNENEVGLNAPGCRCACGYLDNVTLRLSISLGEAIRTIIGYDPGVSMMI